MIRLIKNGRVIDPANQVDEVRNIWISKGLVAEPAATEPADSEVIDATGMWVIPGIIDLAARFREPGEEHKGTIASESAAALGAGITSVCLQPDTIPVVDTPAVVDLIKQRAERCTSPNLYTFGAMSIGLKGEQLSEYAALKAAGCIGISQAGHAMANNQLMRNAMSYAASHDLKIYLTPEDIYLTQEGCAHEGSIATRLGLPGIPAAAETVAVARDLQLIEATGVSAHFCRLSCAESVNLINNAQQRGLAVTADVAAHQLFLTEIDINGFNSQCHVRPPFRSQRDKATLLEGIDNGVITAICSDHQPHEADTKLAPFGETSPGISGLNSLLPLVLKLIHEELLTAKTAINSLTQGPATITGIKAGSLSVGMPADITLISPDVSWTLDLQESPSLGKNSPFNGWTFQGRATQTLVAGKPSTNNK